jgi:DtxR family transcriptional regulator, Mn-dependent transcriptional regulator
LAFQRRKKSAQIARIIAVFDSSKYIFALIKRNNMGLSQTEENYLKCIFKIQHETQLSVLTNQIATKMLTTAGTVTDMIRRLASKDLVMYEKYKGVQLTNQGEQIALQLIRKHRLWEVFLHDKLGFEWDKVHDIAEELEHVSSTAFVDRLDHFLGQPRFDPHGDPIPDALGHITIRQQHLLADVCSGTRCIITGVQEHSSAFLGYLQSEGLTLGAELMAQEIVAYDRSRRIDLHDSRSIQISEKVSRNLFVQVLEETISK